MKTRLFIAASLTVIGLSVFAQEQKLKLDESRKLGSAEKSQTFSLQCQGEINTPTADLKWRPILTTKCIAREPKEPDEELIEKIKAEKLILKQKQVLNKNDNSEIFSKTVTPLVGSNWLGNTNTNNSPLDNNIAISDGGIIVSVANNTIEIDDVTGNNLYYNGIATFYNDNSITNVCDPVILYDKLADRFVFFFQECSGNSSNSYICICFSKTNNPATGGWWKYKLSGNPLNDYSWFDYPKMAVSNNELYITGNLFNNSAVFKQAILYQIQKTAGYSGGSLSWQYWQNISGSPFTLLPVGNGQGLSYGPGCYLVSTYTTSGASTIKLYDLTDDMSGTPSLNYYSVSTTTFSPAANASQLGTSCLLDNGSCRALSGFFLNGIIHFVFHSDYQNTGYNGINYNRLNVSALTNTSSTFGLTGYDYSYPSIASYATTTTDKSVMIGFGRSGSSIYPEVRVVNCDDAMNWSGSTLIKSSVSYVKYTSTTKERWGDYTGITRKHNSSKPTVYVNGMFGNSSNKWDTWIAQISDNSTPAPVANFTANPTNGNKPLTVYFTDNSTNSPNSWSWSCIGGVPSSSTLQNPSITYNTPGSYGVSLTSYNSGGSNTITKNNYITITLNNGIQEYSINNNAKIYPNPIIETFTLEFTLFETSVLEINIFDVSGKIVKTLYEGKGNQGENIFSFNKANLSTGTYFLSIKSNSKIIKNEKIIITN